MPVSLANVSNVDVSPYIDLIPEFIPGDFCDELYKYLSSMCFKRVFRARVAKGRPAFRDCITRGKPRVQNCVSRGRCRLRKTKNIFSAHNDRDETWIKVVSKKL